MKLIIDNRTKLSDANAILRVMKVIALGRISETKAGKQYCFVSSFDDCVVCVRKRAKSSTETFTIFIP